MARIQLAVQAGKLTGESFMVDAGEEKILGRSQQCDIQIPDQGISRQHCRVINQSGRLELEDLHSSNGTYINGQAIRSCHLQDEMELAIGQAVILVRIEYTEDEKKNRRSERPKSLEGNTLSVIDDRRSLDAALRRQIEQDAEVLSQEISAQKSAEQLRQRLNAVCHLANSIFSDLSVDRILDTAAEVALEMCGAERVAILLEDENSVLQPVMTRTTRLDQSGEEFCVSRTILDETVRQGVSVLSKDATNDERFNAGASVMMQGIQSVMCVPLRTENKIFGAIYVDSTSLASAFAEADLHLLAAVGQQAGAAVERAQLVTDLEQLFVGSMFTLIASIEAKDAYTRGHSERVTAYALQIGHEVGLDEETLSVLELAGLLHDAGKIGVPELVLLKPDRLTDEEFAEIRKHPVQGERIIQNMPKIARIVNMEEIIRSVRHHHERFDGAGYPDGLAGDEIPYCARILAVADTFDAITSDRPYRNGQSPEKAVSILTECSGSQFDPALVNAFVSVYNRGETRDWDHVSGRFRKAVGDPATVNA